MREIKFRAWDKKQKEFIESNRFCIFPNGKCVDVYGLYDNGYHFELLYSTYEDIILMQYTGLKDKNGNEIYEGDIVRRYINSRGILYPSNYKKNIIEVKFENSAWNIRKQTERLEIIGNIYENPELLS